MPEHKYRLRYRLTSEAGEFTRADVADGDENTGLSDALMLISMLFPADGSYSQRAVSMDGRNGGEPLSPLDNFKVWMVMGMGVIDDVEDLPPRQRALAEGFHKLVMGFFQ